MKCPISEYAYMLWFSITYETKSRIQTSPKEKRYEMLFHRNIYFENIWLNYFYIFGKENTAETYMGLYKYLYFIRT